MSLDAAASRVIYTGNDSTDTFAVEDDGGNPIYFEENDHINLQTYTVATGVFADLVEGVDYTLTGAGTTNGSVVLSAGNLATGVNLIIWRVQPLDQGENFLVSGAFASATHDLIADRDRRIDQDLFDETYRALKMDRAEIAFVAGDKPIKELTFLDLKEGSAPATPPSGYSRYYVKSDGDLYQKDDSGDEVSITGQVSLATDSAAAAAASASSAASSATSASTSATAAAASYDAFDDRFLGAKTSDPLVDNDGAALSAGMLYYNTATGNLRVYGGASWANVTGVTSINGESGIVTIDADDLDAMTHAAMRVINAADYVVGDGVTDDTAALASAFTAANGKTLYVPAGLTILTGNISLLYSSPTNIPSRVVAHGATFKAKSGLSTASYLLTLENVHGSAANFRWEGGTFNCDGKCRGIRIHGMQRGYVGHIRVIKSYAYAVDIEGDSGYGIYYNLWENWRIGESGSENGSTGINDYANGSTYYNGANMFLNCTVQFNRGHGIAIDYSQNNYVGCSIEKNDLYGYSFNHTHATTIVGGYSENNHLNWATDGASDGSTDYSFNFVATNTTGVKIYGGRHAPANGTLSGGGNVVDVAYPGNQGIFFDGTTFAANGQYKFPATQNASTDANTLDDYEEGTWTPAITFGGGSTGLTHSAQEGTYTKIGRQVFVRGSLTLSARGSSTGQARVTGLPFSCASGKTGTIIIDYYSGLALATGIVAEVPGGSSSASFYIPGASSSAGATDANFTNTSALWFSGFYHV